MRQLVEQVKQILASIQTLHHGDQFKWKKIEERSPSTLVSMVTKVGLLTVLIRRKVITTIISVVNGDEKQGATN